MEKALRRLVNQVVGAQWSLQAQYPPIKVGTYSSVNFVVGPIAASRRHRGDSSGRVHLAAGCDAAWPRIEFPSRRLWLALMMEKSLYPTGIGDGLIEGRAVRTEISQS